jgi:hypothetical protein
MTIDWSQAIYYGAVVGYAIGACVYIGLTWRLNQRRKQMLIWEHLLKWCVVQSYLREHNGTFQAWSDTMGRDTVIRVSLEPIEREKG